jgi:uncharacterized repeat protein (TIGR03803 family)
MPRGRERDGHAAWLQRHRHGHSVMLFPTCYNPTPIGVLGARSPLPLQPPLRFKMQLQGLLHNSRNVLLTLAPLLVLLLPAAAQNNGRMLRDLSGDSGASSPIRTAVADFQVRSTDEGTDVSQGKRGCVSNCNAQSLATGGGEYGLGAFYSFKYDPKIIIHPKDSFNGANGSNPTGDLVRDSKAKLGPWFYGTAQNGGTGCGTVFEAGSDAVDSIYSFQGGIADGCEPTGLIVDKEGNLFGTTQNGGAAGHGTAFELSPNKDGTWTESLIYSFCTQMNCSDGDEPVASLVIDKEGNLFGTTSMGGSSPTNGTIFELSPNGNGGYNETVLYNFVGGSTGGQPGTALTPSNRSFYGTTEQGGIVECDSGAGCGVVYELSPNKAGSGWTYTVIHSFSGSDGAFPEARLISDDAGNFFGTTSQGGIAGNCEGMSSKVGCGTVFELSSQGAFSTLYLFQGGTDGAGPEASLAIDASGDLYGTTFYGGGTGCKKLGGCGTIFELVPQGGGVWNESVLERFDGSNGESPASGLILSK